MAIKLIAFSPKGYVSDPLNICDGSIVILSVVEMSIYTNFRYVRIDWNQRF